MKHFKKSRFNYRYMIDGFKERRLYPYTPRNNEFEKGLKYQLCDSYYCPEWGEQRTTCHVLVSSIREAEKIVNEWGF